ncbi:NmrA family NAD(P)-binding protein [Pseudofrankia sp. BMG5.37]|uniref:NmrA family NAD(P)-binding protein n=1 Tax=Pseudofrankia sp. BMG5.37 TaxID=3050035 RepID=UPI00289683C4|nr:NmrA family NAD(P)-binding protein [Pseudofrankia sp. BMG5.37]
MSPPAVLVIGASGAIGSALIDELVPDHQTGLLRLVAATRRQEAARPLRERGIEVRHLDLDDAETGGLDAIQSIFEGIDKVFILTGYDVRMLAQSKAAVDAANGAGVSHVVHLGVSAAEDTTVAHFIWHQLVEAYIERSGLGFTHVRPSGFMQNLRLSLGAPGVLTHFVGDGRPNWVDIGDIAAVAATVLRDPKPHHGRAYDLAAEAASITEIADLLGEVTGRPWRYEPAEPRIFYEQMVAAGYDPIYMSCVRNTFERTINGSLVDPADVYDTIETVIGRQATSLRQFLERHRDTFVR